MLIKVSDLELERKVLSMRAKKSNKKIFMSVDL